MKTTRPPDTYESVALGALMPFAVFCYYLK